MSVRGRLVLLLVLALAGFATLFAVEEIGGDVVRRTEQLADMIGDIRFEVLQMRRHEKNFLLRRDRQYIQVVGRHQAAAHKVLEGINTLDEHNREQCVLAIGLLDRYWSGFQALAATYVTLGLTDARGMLHAFIEQHVALVEAVRRLGGRDEDIGLLDLEAKENYYLLAEEQEAAAAVFEALPALEGHNKHTLTRGPGEAARGVLAAISSLRAAVQARPVRSGEREEALARIDEVQGAFEEITAAVGRRMVLEVELVTTIRKLESVITGIHAHYLQERAWVSAQVRAVQLAVELATVLAVTLLILWIARSIARPLKSIQRYSNQVAAGDLEARAEGGFSAEFAQLHQDITRMVEKLRDMIQDLRAKEEEAHREAERANEAMCKAEAASRMKSAFLSLVSHELKTPLTSVLGYLKLARKRLRTKVLPGLTGAEGREELDRLQSDLEVSTAEGGRLAELVDKVIDLVEMESGEALWDMAPVSLAEVVEEAVSGLRVAAEDKGLDLGLDLAGGLPPVSGSRERLVQAVESLVCNAIKFTQQGKVSLRAEHAGNEVVVSVADTGPGIPKEQQAELFQPFRQIGDPLTGKPAGLGLDLAVCKLIVAAHHGRVWVESAPGQGSTFCIALPALAG